MSSNGEKPDLRDLRDRLAMIERGALALQFHDAPAGAAAERSQLARRLEALAGALGATTAGAIATHAGDGAGVPASPALTLRSADGRAVDYLALPEGPEREPFAAALVALAQAPPAPEDPRTRRLAALMEPAEVLVFIAASCPHCPTAVAAALKLAVTSPTVRVAIVDAQLYPELAAQHGTRSVPTTVVDRGLTIVGAVAWSELADKILSRGTEEYDTAALRSLVEAGQAATAAAELGSRWGNAFCAAWRASTTSLRMGLLLAAEEALAENPAALDGLVRDLLPSLASADVSLRGDTADLLGRIGHPAAAERLRALLADPDADVADAASEAIQAITRRTTPP